MEKLVNNQSSKIKDLASEIKKFKVQKVELGKKLKEDKDNFQKFKMKKMKELLTARKENFKKETHIKKLMLENKKKSQSFKKKEEELFRAKRINEALKNLVKPTHASSTAAVSHNRKTSELQSPTAERGSKQMTFPSVSEKSCEEHIIRCIRKILTQIDQEKVIAKYEKKVRELS